MSDYETFHQLHYQSQPLILANVWNAKSAQIAESSGFKAVATSSGAIAESLGYKDGENIPFSELLYIVQRIKASISIPLSVDMERGYTDDLELLNKHSQQLIDCGVVGINLEDAQGEDIYLKKLNGIKNYLVKTNQQLFINARTDGFCKSCLHRWKQQSTEPTYTKRPVPMVCLYLLFRTLKSLKKLFRPQH